jgi:phospholipase C
VVLMQSGHSFDNYFGTYPGADGITQGVCLRPELSKTSTNGCVQPFHLGNEPVQDLEHSLSVWSRQYDNGLMDGTVAAYRALGLGTNTPMGYYDSHDLPYYWGVAQNYVLFDHFFSSAPVGTRLNRFWWVAGRSTPGNLESLPKGGYGNIPTIFDRLEAAGVSWKFYVQGYHPNVTFRSNTRGKNSEQTAWVPLVDFPRFVDQRELNSHIVDMSQYYTDLNSGTLPAVAFMTSAQSNESPPGNIQAGQQLVRQLTTSLVMSRYWRSSAFMWTYDDWGGWYDQMKPPQGYGFRVPALLMSPYAKKGQVNHTVLDYTSILRFTEYNWRLAPLASRDYRSNNLLSAFDFTAGPRPAQLIGQAAVLPEANVAPAVSILYLLAMVVGIALALWAWLTTRSPDEVIKK